MYTVRILETKPVTHNVRHYYLEKPEGFKFIPGQATDVSINKPGFEENKHPFTFTSLNDEPNLRFTIKSYPVAEFPTHSGVTEKLWTLVPGDELIIDDPWGTINYKGEGTFIAGGAGITPFIAIFRDLDKKGEIGNNKLIFSNKTSADVILEQEFREFFKEKPENLILTLTQEQKSGYESGRVNPEFLKKHVSDFTGNFYLCGPKPMVRDLREMLASLGAKTESVVIEA